MTKFVCILIVLAAIPVGLGWAREAIGWSGVLAAAVLLSVDLVISWALIRRSRLLA